MSQHLTAGRASPTPALLQVHMGLLLYPFPSYTPLPTRLLLSTAPAYGVGSVWGVGRTSLCDEPEATSQLAVLVAKGEPRGVGLVPGTLGLLPKGV